MQIDFGDQNKKILGLNIKNRNKRIDSWAVFYYQYRTFTHHENEQLFLMENFCQGKQQKKKIDPNEEKVRIV